jgi:hypothetical protein
MRAWAAQEPARMVGALPMREISGTAIPLFFSPYLQTVYSNTSSSIRLSRYDGSCRPTVPRAPAAIP